MSQSDDRNLIDEQALEEYLKRGAPLSQRYRAASNEEPPAALDQRVLAMARHAITQPAPSKSRPQWLRWSAPLALAASAVLVVSIVIESGVYKETTTLNAPAAAPQAVEMKSEASAEPALHDHAEYERVYVAPAEAPADAALLTPESSRAEEQRTEAITSAAPSGEQKSAREQRASREHDGSREPREDALRVAPAQVAMRPQFAPAPSAPPPSEQRAIASSNEQPASAPVMSEAGAAREDHDLGEVVVTAQERRSARGPQNGPRSTVRPAAAATHEAARERNGGELKEAAAWLEEIRTLRKADRHEEADREWRAFRTAYPDLPVAATDIAVPVGSANR